MFIFPLQEQMYQDYMKKVQQQRWERQQVLEWAQHFTTEITWV